MLGIDPTLENEVKHTCILFHAVVKFLDCDRIQEKNIILSDEKEKTMLVRGWGKYTVFLSNRSRVVWQKLFVLKNPTFAVF